MSAPRSPDSASATPYNEKEIIELAWQEGHDADIPSNAGFVAEDSAKDADSFSGSADRDLEKGGKPGSVNSSTVEESKITHTADIEECQPSSTVEPTAADPDVVDWDGPDDPANPMNFSGKVKVIHIAILSLLTLVTPLASSMFAPGVPEVMRDFKTDSATLASFVVSVYILGFAFGPLAVAPMSELYGRYWIYTICNALFIICKSPLPPAHIRTNSKQLPLRVRLRKTWLSSASSDSLRAPLALHPLPSEAAPLQT